MIYSPANPVNSGFDLLSAKKPSRTHSVYLLFQIGCNRFATEKRNRGDHHEIVANTSARKRTANDLTEFRMLKPIIILLAVLFSRQAFAGPHCLFHAEHDFDSNMDKAVNILDITASQMDANGDKQINVLDAIMMQTAARRRAR